MEFKQITYKQAIDFLLPKHYSGRAPIITVAFGWFDGEELKAVCSFGKPASPSLCVGVCGKEWSKNVYELNRLCRTDDFEKPLSEFVARCLRELRQKDWIIVSYSDTAMNHHGYIYQATNFLYTGKTKERTEMYVANGKHSRHYDASQQGSLRKVRSSKHRYVYFCSSRKQQIKIWRNCLRYPVIDEYPKGDNNEDYTLGIFLKDNIITWRNKDGKDD